MLSDNGAPVSRNKAENMIPRRYRKTKEQEVPMMSWNHIEQRGKGGKIVEEEDRMNETIIGIDRENTWISATVVKKKGLDLYATEGPGKERELRIQSGYHKVSPGVSYK